MDNREIYTEAVNRAYHHAKYVESHMHDPKVIRERREGMSRMWALVAVAAAAEMAQEELGFAAAL